MNQNQKKDIENAMNEMNENNIDVKNQRHENQVRLVLKNKLFQLARQFKDSDYENDGCLTYDRLIKDVRKVGVSDQLVTDHDVRKIFEKFQIENNDKFNYRKFLKKLKTFEYEKNSFNVICFLIFFSFLSF